MRASKAGMWLLPLVLSIFLIIAERAHTFAEDYTAATVADFGDVAVMAFTGALDAPVVGSYVEPLETIANEFYRTHTDDYDFLTVYSGFDFKMPESDQANGFYHFIRNDVQGIGLDMFDSSSFYGSGGRLQGAIVMGCLKDNVSDPLDPAFTRTMTVLSHEILHRWAVYITFQDTDGTLSEALLGKDKGHWSFLLDSDGSLMYGNNWQDNGDGTFTSLPGHKYYSALDLYLMGMIDKSQVPPLVLIENPEIDPTRLPAVGETISGTARTITIDDIIAAEGERSPSANDAQKQFRVGTILIVRPGEQYQNDVARVQAIMDNWPMWFSALTDGKGSVVCDAALIEDIPENPGAGDQPYDPGQPPREIVAGVDWLMANQGGDGSWRDLALTAPRDTALALRTLSNFPAAQANCDQGLAWLVGKTPVNSDYLSKAAESLVRCGQPVTTLIADLKVRRNPDGGWGADKQKYNSNPLDTACALKALTDGGVLDTDLISPAVAYLVSRQRADGGWSDTR